MITGDRNEGGLDLRYPLPKSLCPVGLIMSRVYYLETIDFLGVGAQEREVRLSVPSEVVFGILVPSHLSLWLSPAIQ